MDALGGEDNTGDQAMLGFLTEKRMCSVENLALHFGQAAEFVWGRVKELEARGFVRVARKSYGHACSSCPSSCEARDDVSQSIVISLQRKEGPDEC